MDTQAERDGTQREVDGWGAIASTTCTVHCAAVAFLPLSAFEFLRIEALRKDTLELVLSLIAVAIALVALVIGWRTHGRALILVPLAFGIIGLMTAKGIEDHDDHGDETTAESNSSSAEHTDEHDDHAGEFHFAEVLSIGSGIFLVLGHIINLGAMRQCNAGYFEGEDTAIKQESS